MQKLYIVLAPVVLSFIFLLPLTTSAEEIKLKFSKALEQEELLSVINDVEYNIEELYFEHGDIQGGYTIEQDESLDGAFRRLQESHLNFLSTAISDESQEVTKYNEKLLKDLLRSEKITKDSKFKVSGVTITTNDDNYDTLLNPLVSEVHIKSKETGVTPVVSALSSYYVAARLWYPTRGTAKVDKTIAYNTFYFNDASGFDYFNGILTYEHETQVYDKNFSDYGGYWSSNLPNAYKDTPFLDSIDNFTIGSSKASSIVANTKYYTSMSLKSGSASSASVRIKGQLGHRSPSSCYSTWCIYADMTTPTLKSLTAPASTVSWTYTP